jgi:hypothetical protein
MVAPHTPAPSTTLERARRRFERWRSTRPSRIPHSRGTVEVGVEAAREHGVTHLARACLKPNNVNPLALASPGGYTLLCVFETRIGAKVYETVARSCHSPRVPSAA